MRVCYFGTYEEGYPRNEMFLEGMRRAGVTVSVCHQSIWQGQRDKTGVYRGLNMLRMFLRIARAYLLLIVRYLHMPRHDVLMVGYIGHLDMLLAFFLSRLRRVPLVFNVTLSIYDTFCDGRGLVTPGSLTGRAFWLLDYLSSHAADLVMTDTLEYARYFAHTFRVPKSRLCVVPLGADDRLFQPPPVPAHPTHPDQPCEVVFVGKFIPLHGCETIVRAAALLKDEPVHITMIGTGQDYPLVEQMIANLHLDNVTLAGWVEREQLASYYARADVCLGSFGASGRAGRAISNKVYESMAMQRAVLTAETPAVRSELHIGEDVWVCKPGDTADLAAQITCLAADPALRQRIAQQGYATFQQRYHLRAIGETIRQCLTRMLPDTP